MAYCPVCRLANNPGRDTEHLHALLKMTLEDLSGGNRLTISVLPSATGLHFALGLVMLSHVRFRSLTKTRHRDLLKVGPGLC
jgi:hypothetical protein